MLNRIQRWLGGSGESTWDLSGYAAFELPHAGAGAALSESQAQENWAAWQAALPARQALLRDWLLDHGGPDPQALAGADYATALNVWAKTHWARLPPFKRLPPHPPWPDCPRHGAHVVYSLLGDLAASLGEAIRRADPQWRWGLNLDATDLADDMATARRIVLLAELRQPTPEARQAVLDPEAWVFGPYRFPESVDFVYRLPWAEAVSEELSGRHQDF
jgi:hypothetical protein